MSLPEFSIHRPVTVLMGCMIAMLLGVISFLNISVDLMPEIEYPTISVSTRYEGVAPEEMETQKLWPRRRASKRSPPARPRETPTFASASPSAPTWTRRRMNYAPVSTAAAARFQKTSSRR